MRDPLINKSAVRKYILSRVKEARPGWPCSQVANAVFLTIDIKLKRIIDGAIHSHCSSGKTFRDIL